MAVCR